MLRCALSLFLLPFFLFAEKKEVTVVMQFSEGFSPQALQEMQAEADRIVRKAGLKLAFRHRHEAAQDSYSELIFFKMSGRCEMDAFPALLDERGPLAFTFTTDGRILPFGEVKCDRLRESIKTAMAGSDFAQGNQLLGRAMGRVLAHELYHMIARTKGHGKGGVAKESLSARQLIAEHLDLTDHDCSFIRSGSGKKFL
jgi:hypothetical protein